MFQQVHRILPGQDHFNSLAQELSSDKTGAIAMMMIDFVRRSLNSSINSFKPTHHMLNTIFNRIAMVIFDYLSS
jgi:hypothetical protein